MKPRPQTSDIDRYEAGATPLKGNRVIPIHTEVSSAEVADRLASRELFEVPVCGSSR